MYISEYGNWIIEKDELLKMYKGELKDPREIYPQCGTLTGRTYHTRFKTERCIKCKEASRLWDEKYRRSKGIPEQLNVTHGSYTMYNYHGCRCYLCKKSNSDYKRSINHKSGRHIPLDEYDKTRPKRYTDWFNATFLGTLTENIENRFKNWTNAKKYGFSRKEINEYHKQYWNCWYCEEHLLNKVIEIDHRLPVSRGGQNEIENLVLSCLHCNRSKQNKTEIEYNQYRR